jgi:PAS domain S-box-containing protein
LLEESADDLYENAPCGFFSTLEDGTIVRVNQTFLTWTGYRRGDLVARKRIHDLLPPGDRIYYETHYAPLLRMQGAVREVAVEIARADGSRLAVLLNSVLEGGSGDAPLLVRTAVFGATDRRRYERELLQARRQAERLFSELDSERRRLRSVLEAMREGVVTVDRGLRVRFANRAAHKIHGFGRLVVGELLPEAWAGFSLRNFVAGLFSEAAREHHAEHSPGPDASYSITGIPAHRADEALLVFTELSELSRRQQAEREFVANAAHELRTPLTAISSAIDVLQSGAKEIPEDRDLFLGDIEREAARLRRLTRALLLLAEIQAQREPPAVEAVDLRALLEGTALGMQVREGVAVEVECEPGATAWTNADLVAQALASVAANASKYTLAGRISLGASVDDDGATIVAADTGPGIALEDQERLFERFYRAEGRGGEGFGLGLSIASQAVESLGGTIEVRASADSGTTVVIRLPARQPPRRKADGGAAR